MQDKQPKIVVIGGGSGSFTILSGLKHYTDNLTAIVNMADDGGSTGVLRDELGVLPPGDVRQCLVALSDTEKLRDLFNFRFEEGALTGHSFGNLFLSALEKMTSSFEEAVEVAGEVLHIHGRVVPVTLDQARLIATSEDGQNVTGESVISETGVIFNRPQMKFESPVKVNPAALQAIVDADIVVIAPGDLYTSLAPALIVDGLGQALATTKAKVVDIINLVTKQGQTDGLSVSDFAEEIERLAGVGPILDYVIYNTDKPADDVSEKYMRAGEYLATFDPTSFQGVHYKAIGLPLIDKTPVQPSSGDSIAHTRSLIRHDSTTTAQEIMKIYDDYLRYTNR